ncbi:MAG: DUF3772 domain-containing protein, partial [Sulfitobacter sp.]
MFRILAGLAALLLAGTVAAQQPKQISDREIELWESAAGRAETAIDDRTDDSKTFEALRARITEFRSDFAGARQVNAERIETLRAQIAALGEVAEGTQEPVDIADRRRELEQQLATLQAPVLVADAAFRRADGLIREIDTIIRDRQTRTLLSLGPSPLYPPHWGPAVLDLGKI